MSGKFLLGVDIGTSASKGVIVDMAGRVTASAGVPHDVSMPRPGWAEHDADKVWWGDFCQITRKLLDISGLTGRDIGAVGCSAIAPCVLPIDERGRPMRSAILYGIDTRSVPQIRALEHELGLERMLHAGGCALSTQSVGPKIRWLHDEEPEIYERAYKFLTGSSYLVYRLTGECVVDRYTGCAYAPLFNQHDGRWDSELCPAIVDPERLPRLGWTADVAGEVTRQAAAETGLAVGTPVTVGTADAAAEAVSVGVVAPGKMMLMYGSSTFFVVVTDELTVDERLWAGIYLFPGIYSLAGGTATAGSVTRWFRDNFAHAEMGEEQRTGRNAYELLAAGVDAVPVGAEGLIVLPYFAGERTPLNDPRARGMIAGLALTHTRAHVYRAILEGVGYGIRHNLEIVEELGQMPTDIIAIGGGTSNRTWLQIVSDITGVHQLVPTQRIGAAYGDAFLAGFGIGAFKSYREIESWVDMADRIEPDPEAHRVYQAYYSLYRELYEESKCQIHKLAHLGGGA